MPKASQRLHDNYVVAKISTVSSSGIYIL